LIHGWKEQTHVPLVGPTSDFNIVFSFTFHQNSNSE
jgi:hypothetical protein